MKFKLIHFNKNGKAILDYTAKEKQRRGRNWDFVLLSGCAEKGE
jgi:hypothetical protein